MVRAINGLVLRMGGCLIVNKRGVWIFPGGKITEGETDEACLQREFREELSGTRIQVLEPYGTFSGITPYSRREIEVELYYVDICGKLKKPSREIQGAAFVNRTTVDKYPLSEITSQIINQLIRKNII